MNSPARSHVSSPPASFLTISGFQVFRGERLTELEFVSNPARSSQKQKTRKKKRMIKLFNQSIGRLA